MRALVLLACLALGPVVASASAEEALPRLELKGGEGTPIPDTGLVLLVTGLTDQRCPAEVDCFWEGMIRVELTVLGPKADLQDIVLCNQCADGSNLVTVGELTIGLVGLAPSTVDLARLGRAPVLTDYVVTLSYGQVR